jgi:SAM-dependent methyltransferase
MNFSFDTIDNFEEHIETSVPGYKQLNEYIISILGYFLNNSKLVDIGCSTGYLLNKISFFYPDNELIGLDISQNLFNQAKINDKISLVEFDLNKEELIKADVYTSIFTLQFLPITTRIKIIKDIYTCLVSLTILTASLIKGPKLVGPLSLTFLYISLYLTKTSLKPKQ